jgi:hypothetical protein
MNREGHTNIQYPLHGNLSIFFPFSLSVLVQHHSQPLPVDFTLLLSTNENIKMGGGNAQKSAAAREKNLKKVGKTDEERKAANDKAKKDSSAFVCAICRTSFMVNVTSPTLYLHVTSKHPAGIDPASCFPQLATYDPTDPKGLKKAAPAAAAAPAKPKKKKDVGGIDLLSAGLKPKKGKK